VPLQLIEWSVDGMKLVKESYRRGYSSPC